MARSKVLDALSQITDELKNFERIAKAIKPKPGSIPELDGIDVHGEIIPLNGIVGGDHLIYMDFKKRYDLDARIRRAEERGAPRSFSTWNAARTLRGIALIDVAGHQSTDSMLAEWYIRPSDGRLVRTGHVWRDHAEAVRESQTPALYRSSLVKQIRDRALR